MPHEATSGDLTKAGTSIPALLHENTKLRKINRVLMERVERSMDAQGTSAFGLFQAAIVLEKTVRERTAELSRLNTALRREIDERVEIEEALRTAKLAAERANASKTRFFAAASHDLLQPVNVARLFLDALSERKHDSETVGMLERMDAALDAVENLLNTLLDISKLDAGAMAAQPASFPIDHLLTRMAAEYMPAAIERGLKFRVHSCDALVYTDYRLLERVVRNLLSNALRYTNRGGVLIGCRRRRHVLRLEVWDTGIGIPQEKLGEIFEEFRQLPNPNRRRDKGMGLGLAIVDRITQLLQLPLDVRSVEGKGSVFGVEIPYAAVSDQAAVAEGSRNGGASADPVRGKRILILDDDEGTLDGLAIALRGWGCTPFTASSTEEAVRVLSIMRSVPDLIITDYHLGDGTTGIDAIDRLCEESRAAIPALVVTADRAAGVKALASERGFWFLTKPVHLARLRSLVSHVLA